MPSNIHLLSESVTHMIAAGEVVEGAHSVIKELLENAIDAGAGSVVIEAEESGSKRIYLRDDGSGIYREDLTKAVMEHATSKITTVDDIHAIYSYGFRGEALSSIAAVSKMTILSRRDDEENGGRISNESGGFVMTDFAGPRGTTVIVENLFYNTPARKKFLRSPSAESRMIRETVLRSALAHHEIAYTLEINGNKIFQLSACADAGGRIEQIFGGEEYRGLTREALADIKVSIEGFLSRPHISKATRGMQYLFVNGRPVEMKSLGFLLSRVYESALPHGRYPAAVLFITIAPDLIDVNIHPAKREIKFFDQRYIEQIIGGLVKKALASKEQPITAEDIVSMQDELYPFPERESEVTPQFFLIKEHDTQPCPPQRDVQPSFDFTVLRRSDAARSEMPSSSVPAQARIIGMLFGTYILAEADDTLKVIDFHAAHERITYDSIIKREREIESQELVFPEVIELSKGDFADAVEMLDELNARGFDAEEFSGSSIVVRAVPSILKESSIKDFFKDLVSSLGESRDLLKNREHRVASRIACHASKRASEYLTRSDMQMLADTALSGKHVLTCPHGRPYLYSMSRAEFEKLFRR